MFLDPRWFKSRFFFTYKFCIWNLELAPTEVAWFDQAPWACLGAGRFAWLRLFLGGQWLDEAHVFRCFSYKTNSLWDILGTKKHEVAMNGKKAQKHQWLSKTNRKKCVFVFQSDRSSSDMWSIGTAGLASLGFSVVAGTLWLLRWT